MPLPIDAPNASSGSDGGNPPTTPNSGGADSFGPQGAPGDPDVSTMGGRTTARNEDETLSRATIGRNPELKVVFSPDSALVGTRHPLTNDTLLIGRDVQGDGSTTLRIRDPRASRLHTRISWDPHTQCRRVGDANSFNGTFINGEPVETAIFEPGDLLRIGDTLLTYDEENRMERVRARARRGAGSDLTILVLGETGTGKDVLARAIHEQSERTGAFVAVNCATLPKDLIAVELFGHTKGAFSGASGARRGLFATAQGGTLFLDEVAELPIELQATLLRAVQDGSIRPVGGDHEAQVDVRIVAATNVDLDEATAAGRFRQDLNARLAELVFRLPPLRERRQDILALVAELAGEQVIDLSPDAAEALLLWSWPGNIRELKTVCRNYLALAESDDRLDLEAVAEITPEMAAPLIARRDGGHTEESGDKDPPVIRREHLRVLLKKHKGNVSSVAKELDKTRAHVYRWMKRFGLTADPFR